MANSSAYEAIVRAGPRLNQLQQVHAHLIPSLTLTFSSSPCLSPTTSSSTL
ncbi:BnaC04g44110D [Brassica napus]|uniref:BnaC04g44110D protein n=1 Tax=Brassica napus TaxID=3708 RepID=A0A078IRU7_BRANA|nr:BnaC04g44110D [Brassica napus]